MPQQLKTRIILPALGLLAAVMLWAAPTASAAGFSMTISTSPTTGMSLTNGVYTPTASDANLNPTDLVNELVADNVSIENAESITIDSSINATGSHNLTFSSPASLGSDTTITVGGNLTFSSTIDGPSNLTLGAGGTVSLDGDVGDSQQLASLAVPTAASIDVAATIGTTGTQAYSAPITLTGRATFGASTGDIAFDSTINGAQDLTVSTPGTASFDAAVGATTPLGSLAVLAPASATLGGNVSTTGAQTYGGAVRLVTSDVTLTSTGGSLTFSSTVDGAGNLTLNAEGTVGLEGTVGDTARVTSLAIPSAAAINIGASLIWTTTTQTYGAPVTLTGDVTTESNSTSAITFDSTIDGHQELTISTNGPPELDGAVGSHTPLANIAVLGGSDAVELGGNVTTTDTQDYGGQVVLESDVTLSTPTSVTFGNQITGLHQLTMTGGGTMSVISASDAYSGAVVTGGSTLSFQPGSLPSTGDITLNGGTLQWSAFEGSNSDDVSSQLQIGSGGGTLDTNDNAVTFAHTVGGTGPLTKTGAGTLELNASTGSTYGNQIVVQGGTVLVPSTSTVSTPVVIHSGGELECQDGTITGPVTNQGGTTFGAPGEPTHVTATGGFRTANISFTPGPDNCNPVSYTATSGALTWGPVTAGPITATSLVGGQPYAFTVTATNALGSSTSAASNTITPTPFVPTVAIAAPVNNATYTQGQVVDAGYSCQEGSGGTGIATCAGPVASGAVLDTQTLGTHTFAVTATSSDGYTATATATYTVVASTSSTKKPPNKRPNEFTIHQLKGHPSGSIDVSLASLVGPGTVKVTEHPSGLRAFSVRKTAGAKATLKFTVNASPQLKSSLRNHHRKLNVKVSITYTPRGGKARTVTKTVKV